MLRSSVLAVQRVTILAQRGFRPLSGKWYDLLVTGEHWHRSRSEALRSFLMHVANLGWDWAEVWFHLSQPERYKLAEVIWTRRGGRSRPDAVKRAEAGSLEPRAGEGCLLLGHYRQGDRSPGAASHHGTPVSQRHATYGPGMS